MCKLAFSGCNLPGHVLYPRLDAHKAGTDAWDARSGTYEPAARRVNNTHLQQAKNRGKYAFHQVSLIGHILVQPELCRHG